MVHTYNITGMTCGGCEAKVRNRLLNMPGITDAVVSKETNTATITMQRHIDLAELQHAIGGEDHKYSITVPAAAQTGEAKGWFTTYKPIFLIFMYITGITLMVQWHHGRFDVMMAMRHFMAGFFLTFSFFKFLDLKGFAESYVMYDVIASRIPAWAYLYAFVELALGIANLINFNPPVTNAATLVVMSISIIGVLQSVLNKRKIQCACLGAVFNLPMSTVTIIEDALMIAMSGLMLLLML